MCFLLRRLLLLGCLYLASTGSNALDEIGHRLVALTLAPQLSNTASDQMVQWFGELWPQNLAFYLEQAETDSRGRQGVYLKERQLTLFTVDAEAFDPSLHCLENRCSVAAVLESWQVLQRQDFPDEQRRLALIYLLHFMIELHVPVNLSLQQDEGGRSIWLEGRGGAPTNLAWFWNHEIIREQTPDIGARIEEFSELVTDKKTAKWAREINPQAWAFEGHKIALEAIYPFLEEGKIDSKWRKAGAEVMEEQMVKVVVRSAAMLNQLWPAVEEVEEQESEESEGEDTEGEDTEGEDTEGEDTEEMADE